MATPEILPIARLATIWPHEFQAAERAMKSREVDLRPADTE